MNNDNFGYHGNKAWHGLGMQLPETAKTAIEGFEALGLDWEDQLRPVMARMEDGTMVECTGNKAHVRVDTGDVLGIVSEGYKSVSNIDLANYCDSLVAGTGAKIETAGSLFNGKRIFVAMRLPKTIVANRGDEVLPFLIASNGHGGCASLSTYLSSVRPVCNNTLTMSEKDLATGVRIYHTGDISKKMDQARKIMDLASREADRFAEQVTALSNTDLSKDQIQFFMEKAFAITYGPEPKGHEQDLRDKYIEKRRKMLLDWMSRLENEKQTQFGGAGTAWAALNAYTEWSDHARGGNWIDNRGPDARVHSNMWGVAAVAKRKVFSQALSLIG